MKYLTVILGGISVFALGACTVRGTGSTSTSTGGSGGATTWATTTGYYGDVGGAVGDVGGAGGNGTGGAPACDDAYTCSEAISPPDGDPNKLCVGNPHEKVFKAMSECVCTGACMAYCADNFCMASSPPTNDCTACLQSATGCKTQFDDCANDI
jgi:hypothetical protein